MTFPERTRSECAVLACCGVMVPETSLRLLVQINWWNPLLISLGQFFRWSVRSNLRAKPQLIGGAVQASLTSIAGPSRTQAFAKRTIAPARFEVGWPIAKF